MTPIGCLYVPDFPAWALRAGRGLQRGVVVVDRERVVARDRAAARGGVEAGMTRSRAALVLPTAHIAVRDAAVEAAAWASLLALVHAETPFAEEDGPPMLFFAAAEPSALRALVRAHGLCAGLAGDRETARLAAVRAAPGTVLAVPEARRTAFLRAFPVARLDGLGFSADTAERLALYGLDTLAAAARLTKTQLALQFGPEGERLYGLLHPRQAAARPVGRFTPPPAVTVRLELDAGAGELHELLPATAHLAERLATALGERLAGRLHLVLGPPEAPAATAVRLLPRPTHAPRALLQAAKTLLHEALRPGLDVADVALQAAGLVPPPRRQLDLFARRSAIAEAVERVERRYPGALRRVVQTPHALFEEDAFTLVAAAG